MKSHDFNSSPNTAKLQAENHTRLTSAEQRILKNQPELIQQIVVTLLTYLNTYQYVLSRECGYSIQSLIKHLLEFEIQAADLKSEIFIANNLENILKVASVLSTSANSQIGQVLIQLHLAVIALVSDLIRQTSATVNHGSITQAKHIDALVALFSVATAEPALDLQNKITGIQILLQAKTTFAAELNQLADALNKLLNYHYSLSSNSKEALTELIEQQAITSNAALAAAEAITAVAPAKFEQQADSSFNPTATASVASNFAPSTSLSKLSDEVSDYSFPTDEFAGHALAPKSEVIMITHGSANALNAADISKFNNQLKDKSSSHEIAAVLATTPVESPAVQTSQLLNTTASPEAAVEQEPASVLIKKLQENLKTYQEYLLTEMQKIVRTLRLDQDHAALLQVEPTSIIELSAIKKGIDLLKRIEVTATSEVNFEPYKNRFMTITGKQMTNLTETELAKLVNSARAQNAQLKLGKIYKKLAALHKLNETLNPSKKTANANTRLANFTTCLETQGSIISRHRDRKTKWLMQKIKWLMQKIEQHLRKIKWFKGHENSSFWQAKGGKVTNKLSTLLGKPAAQNRIPS